MLLLLLLLSSYGLLAQVAVFVVCVFASGLADIVACRFIGRGECFSFLVLVCVCC